MFSDGKVEAKTTSYENGDLVVHKFRDRYCVLDRQTSYDIGEFSRLKYAKIFCDELGPIWSGLLRRILDGDESARLQLREMLAAHSSLGRIQSGIDTGL